MKKLRPVVLAVIIGCTCAFFLFKTVEKGTIAESDYNAVAIQIGVFMNPENAERMADTYGGLVFKDEEVYRVYYSILKRDENIEFMTNYLSEKGINYYLKDIKVDDELLEKSTEYEKVMSSTEDDAKLTINKELLDLYNKEVI